MKGGWHGVLGDRGQLWTENREPGRRVYGERLLRRRGKEYRQWIPHRSKLAALQKVARPPTIPNGDILYLGAASGTTVSHLSDMDRGLVYAVEFSPRSMRDLAWMAEGRNNIIPILEDANHPERYSAYIGRPVQTLVQDVAQRNQVEIFLANLPFLAEDGLGYLMVKAPSIDVARKPEEIFRDVEKQLRQAKLKVLLLADLEPFEKQHRAFVVQKVQ